MHGFAVYKPRKRLGFAREADCGMEDYPEIDYHILLRFFRRLPRPLPITASAGDLHQGGDYFVR